MLGPRTPAQWCRWLRDSGRLPHLMILVAAVAVPCLGLLLSISSTTNEVVWQQGADLTLPTLCVSRYFGFECATCGVTRSIIALMHGDLAQSLAFHPFGWLIFMMIVVQIPYRAYRVVSPQRRWVWLETAGYALLITTFSIVLLNYVFRQIGNF